MMQCAVLHPVQYFYPIQQHYPVQHLSHLRNIDNNIIRVLDNIFVHYHLFSTSNQFITTKLATLKPELWS